MIAQFALGLGIVEAIVSLQVIDRECCHHRLLAAMGRLGFRHLCNALCQSQREICLAGAAVQLIIKDPAHFLERNFFIGKDIALACLPPYPQRQYILSPDHARRTD